MKIYHLILNTTDDSRILKIITYPEYPQSDLEVFFKNTKKTIIPNKQIYIYISGLIHSKVIGVDLAKEIIADYPHLFKNIEMEFESKIKNSKDNLFSHLSDEIRSYAEKELAELDKKISQYPFVIKHQVDRAELFANAGHFDIAKEAYEKLRESYNKDDHYSHKIKKGIEHCIKELEKIASVFFQTPYRISFEQTPDSIHEQFKIKQSEASNSVNTSIESKQSTVTYTPTLFASHTPQNSLDGLPDELFFQILNYLDVNDTNGLGCINKISRIKKFRWDNEKFSAENTDDLTKITFMENHNFFSKNPLLVTNFKEKSKKTEQKESNSLSTGHKTTRLTEDAFYFVYTPSSPNEKTREEKATLSSLITKDSESKTILFRFKEDQESLDKIFHIFESTMLPNQLTRSHLAVLCNQLDFIKNNHPMIEQDINAQELDEGNTLLHLAALYGYKELTSLLIDKKAKINQQNKLGHTPALLASRYGHLSCLNVLVSNNADIAICDGNRSTPLHWAVKNNHPLVLDFLLSQGANTLAKGTNQQIPLHVAAEMNHLELFKSLLNQNKDSLKVTDRNGNHSIHLAAQKNSQSVMMYLSVYYPECLSLKNAYQKTCLDLALQAEHHLILWVISNQCPELLSTQDYLKFDKAPKNFFIKVILELDGSGLSNARKAGLFFKTYLLTSFRDHLKTIEDKNKILTEEELQDSYNRAQIMATKKFISILDHKKFNDNSKFNAVALLFCAIAHSRLCDWAFTEDKTDWERIFVDYFNKAKTLSEDQEDNLLCNSLNSKAF